MAWARLGALWLALVCVVAATVAFGWVAGVVVYVAAWAGRWVGKTEPDSDVPTAHAPDRAQHR